MNSNWNEVEFPSKKGNIILGLQLIFAYTDYATMEEAAALSLYMRARRQSKQCIIMISSVGLNPGSYRCQASTLPLSHIPKGSNVVLLIEL